MFIPNFLHCVLQTLDEVSSVEIIKEKLIIEAMITRQENGLKFGTPDHSPFLNTRYRHKYIKYIRDV